MERVDLLRGPSRNADNDPIPSAETPLWAVAVAPGSSEGNKDRGRNGKRVAYTVHFWPVPGQPLPEFQDEDELRVRGTVCSIVVQDWRSPYTGRRGLEVLCSAGKG